MVELLTEEHWRRFDRDGFLRLGAVLDQAQLTTLQQRIDQIMLGEVGYPTIWSQVDTGGAYAELPDPVQGLGAATLAYRKLDGLEADPLVAGLIRHDLFREICGRIYGRHASISIFRCMLMNKPAGQGTHLPWHQDAGDVWQLDRDPLVTVWIALDDATVSKGCLRVIPGSHRLGLLSKNGSTISEEHVQTYCPDDAITYLEVAAGEAILLHNWLLHGSAVNATDAPRRALTTCYMDGRTLGTLTGRRFSMVFGAEEDALEALPFFSQLARENATLRTMAHESERYAKSLLEHSRQLEDMRTESERYAKSLEAELVKLRKAAHLPTAAE